MVLSESKQKPNNINEDNSVRTTTIEQRHPRLSAMLNDFAREVRAFFGLAAVGISVLDRQSGLIYRVNLGLPSLACGDTSELRPYLYPEIWDGYIVGDKDKSDPCFTVAGSFYINAAGNITDLLKCVENRQYASVAIVPIRKAKTLIGLIELADHRDSMFPSKTMRFLEKLSIQLSLSVQWIEAEQAKKESEDRYRTLVDASADLISVIDRNYVYRIVNKTFREYYKRLPGQIIGRKVCQVVGQDDFLKIIGPHLDLCFEGKNVQYETWDSRPGEESRYMCSYYFPLINSDGNIESVVTATQDITARKRAEEALKDQRDKAQQYLDIVGTMIVAIDADQKITLINKTGCQILGCDESQIIGKNWFDNFLPEKIRVNTKNIYRKLMAGELETAEWAENSILTCNGQEKNMRWHNTVLRDDTGKITGTLSSGEDITVRKQAEQKARQQQTELAHASRLGTIGEMASGLSHELNQPLTAIISLAEGSLRMMQSQDNFSPSPDLISAMEEITSQAERAGQIIRRIRSFVQKQEPIRVPTDINLTVDEAVGLAEAQAKQRNVHIRLTPLDRPAIVLADNIQIEQVLLNLIQNSFEAMEYTPQKKRLLTIKISTTTTNDAVKVEVTDQGYGLTEQVKTHMFDSFFTTKNQGLGIGLSLSRSIIESHDGRLWATSSADKGTTFQFVLPIHR